MPKDRLSTLTQMLTADQVDELRDFVCTPSRRASRFWDDISEQRDADIPAPVLRTKAS